MIKVNKEPRKMENWCWINRNVIREHGKVLGAYGISVLTTIASCENDKTKDAFPSISYIANIIGASRVTVIKSIKVLEALGYLEKKKNAGRSTYYTLTTPTGVVNVVNHTSTAGELPPVNVVNSNDTNLTNLNKEIEPLESKAPFLATNYFYSQYKHKYNTNYPVTARGWFIKQLSTNYSEQTFESLKLMIDKYLEGGGMDFQQFIWSIPKLYAVVIDKTKEKAEAERNRKYIEYYSTEAVLKRAQNGDI